MHDFPSFMKNPINQILPSAQATPGVEGYVFDGADGSQMAFWTCGKTAKSTEHVHNYDEYMVVMEGCYTLLIQGQRIDLKRGDEYLIPKGVPHGGEVVAGTRTIHAFGGHRANRAQPSAVADAATHRPRIAPMPSIDQELLSAFDGHDVEGVRAALERGANACEPIRGKLPLDWLLEEYTRSDRLGDCLRLLFARGAVLRDQATAPVLLDDADALKAAVRITPSLLQHKTTLISAFTSLVGVSLLHVAAEYGNVNAARALIEAGADVNARAQVDEHGLNGHTPLFHTVNSIHNRSEPIMRLLLAAGARTDIRLAGITWGKGYEWETTFLDVTPISYAQMGLLPQVHRNERQIYSNLKCLLEASGRNVPPLGNVPNRYLRPKSRA